MTFAEYSEELKRKGYRVNGNGLAIEDTPDGKRYSKIEESPNGFRLVTVLEPSNKDPEFALTDYGKKQVENYINELKAKRKEILDAGKDTADETTLPTIEDIIADVQFLGIDDSGEYYNGWGVTDHYDADLPILLRLGRDLEVVNN